MRKQEDTRLAELAAEKIHFEAIQAQHDIVSGYACHSHHSFWLCDVVSKHIAHQSFWQSDLSIYV